MRYPLMFTLLTLVSASFGCEFLEPVQAQRAGTRPPSPSGSGKTTAAITNASFSGSASRPTPALVDPPKPVRVESPPVTAARPDTSRVRDCSSQFTVEVQDLASSTKLFLTRMDALGGYLEKHENNSLLCRVPPGRFQELNAQIPEMGRVVEKSIKTLDVTARQHETRQRLEEAEAYRKRLQAVMDKTEKSDRIEDLLRIAEFRRVVEETERLREEMRVLVEKTSFSTVAVTWQSQRAPQTSRPTNRFSWINDLGAENLRKGF